VLPQLSADAGEQHAELEGLGHVVVGARLQPEDGVGIRGLRRQHDDGAFEAAAAQELAGLAAVEIGKADIQKHEVDMTAARLLHALRCRRRKERVELLMQAELLAQRFAKFVVIVDDEDLAGIAHTVAPGLFPRLASCKRGQALGQAVSRTCLAHKKAHPHEG